MADVLPNATVIRTFRNMPLQIINNLKTLRGDKDNIQKEENKDKQTDRASL